MLERISRKLKNAKTISKWSSLFFEFLFVVLLISEELIIPK